MFSLSFTNLELEEECLRFLCLDLDRDLELLDDLLLLLDLDLDENDERLELRL